MLKFKSNFFYDIKLFHYTFTFLYVSSNLETGFSNNTKTHIYVLVLFHV